MAFKLFYGSLGWATSPTATSPTTTPTELASITVPHLPITAIPSSANYEYINKQQRGFPTPNAYEAEVWFYPAEFVFDDATGLARSHKLDMGVQNDPKFVQFTDPSWTDRFGSGWVHVVLTETYSLDKSSGQNYYKLKIRTAQTYTLS